MSEEPLYKSPKHQNSVLGALRTTANRRRYISLVRGTCSVGRRGRWGTPNLALQGLLEIKVTPFGGVWCVDVKIKVCRKRVWCADVNDLTSTSQVTVCDLNLCDRNFELALYIARVSGNSEILG